MQSSVKLCADAWILLIWIQLNAEGLYTFLKLTIETEVHPGTRSQF